MKKEKTYVCSESKKVHLRSDYAVPECKVVLMRSSSLICTSAEPCQLRDIYEEDYGEF